MVENSWNRLARLWKRLVGAKAISIRPHLAAINGRPDIAADKRLALGITPFYYRWWFERRHQYLHTENKLNVRAAIQIHLPSLLCTRTRIRFQDYRMQVVHQNGIA